MTNSIETLGTVKKKSIYRRAVITEIFNSPFSSVEEAETEEKEDVSRGRSHYSA